LYFIRFENNKGVKSITCEGTSSYSCPYIYSIGINSNYEEIIGHFGLPPEGYQDYQDGERVLTYPQYNIVFYLTKGKVHKLGIKIPDSEN
jgi:hypothetical protein